MRLSWIALGPSLSRCDLTLKMLVVPVLYCMIVQDGPQVAIAARDELGAVGHSFSDVRRVNSKVDIDVGIRSAKGLDGPPQFGSGYRLLARDLTSKEMDIGDGVVSGPLDLELKGGHPEGNLGHYFWDSSRAT